MKMLYYISEDIQREGMSFAGHLIKRCESFAEAVFFLRDKRNEWVSEGLHTHPIEVGDEWWGMQALNDDFMVVHNYKIFATPMFMAGGEEGL